MKLPLAIFSVDKRQQMAMQSLHDRIPNVQLDAIELEQDFRTDGYFLRCKKGDKVLVMCIDKFPELTEVELATIVLFAG